MTHMYFVQGPALVMFTTLGALVAVGLVAFIPAFSRWLLK